MARHRDEKMDPLIETPSDSFKASGRIERDPETIIDISDQKIWHNTLWLILQVMATLNGRDILRNVFPYPYYFTLLVQLSTFFTLCVNYLILLLRCIFKHEKCPNELQRWIGGNSKALRLIPSSAAATISMLFAANALSLYPSLPTLALLPVLTYVSDSILFQAANCLSLISWYQNISLAAFCRAVLLTIFVLLVIKDEFFLNPTALRSALASFIFSSLSRLFRGISSDFEFKNDQALNLQSLRDRLIAEIPSLAATIYTTNRNESITEASQAIKSWGVTYYIVKLGPAVVLLLFFNNWMLSIHPFVSKEPLGGSSKDFNNGSKNSVSSSFLAGLFVVLLGTINKERCFAEWKQVIPFTLTLTLCLRLENICHHLLRLSNFILDLIWSRERLIKWKLEKTKSLILITTVFVTLLSSFTMFWVNTISYHLDLYRWHDPSITNLDLLYRPAKMRSVDMVIAHSSGNDIADITWLIQAFACLPQYNFITPKVQVYFQDLKSLDYNVSIDFIKGGFEGDVRIQTVRNIGGPTAVYINHTLNQWDTLADHTIFLSTDNITPENLQNSINRLTWYYEPLAHPIPDALPKTGFLNLGPMAVCSCYACYDDTGWSDTFHLVPPIWVATRNKTEPCGPVLLTYGNRFIASAERLRGLKRDTWQLIYDALVSEQIDKAWAHAREKLPQQLNDKRFLRSWGIDGIFKKPDSLEAPYLGLTIERLWGVLLQCSRAKIAWSCPPFHFRHLITNSKKSDCGCID